MSGIGVVAATFLFRGGFQKQNLSDTVARLLGVAGKNAEVAESSAEYRKCWKWHKRAAGDVGGAAEL